MPMTKPLLYFFILALLILPGFVARGGDWRTADRSSVGIAPLPEEEKRAIVQVYAARAFSWRAPYAVHTWIAVKEENASSYTTYHGIGWNTFRNQPVVTIQQDIPDRKWFDRPPYIVFEAVGPEAAAMIPHLDKAARDFPYQNSYRVWPGPNSNTLIAAMIRETPGMTVELPPHAIGKDWLPGGKLFAPSESGSGYQFSLFGLLGATVGVAEGLEVNILGLVFGFDVRRPALKLPFIGRVGMKDAPL